MYKNFQLKSLVAIALLSNLSYGEELSSKELLKFSEVKSSFTTEILETREEIKIDKEISFSAEKLKLRQALFIVSQSAGLNLIIDKDVDSESEISMSLSKTNVKNVLDAVVKSGNCSYTIKDKILYISKYKERTFSIPYIQSMSRFSSSLGGDILGSTKSSEGGLSGNYSLEYKNGEDSGDFYKQIEGNIKTALSEGGKYNLNKFTGTLVVTDTEKVLNSLEDMINKIKKRANRQVVIEAKILEVVLNDGHQLGVEWSNLPSAKDFVFNQTLGLTGAVAGTLSYSDAHINAVISALNTAGDIDALSNPKIKVSSGQSALISSGKIVPFWEKEITYTASSTIGAPATPVVTYSRRDVLDGLSLGVTPIVKDDGTILINIVPITSSIEDTVNLTDPSTSGDNSVIASAPILSIKEAGTIIQANNNELVLIGGLINNTVKKNKKSIPILGDIPYLGALFSQTDNKTEKRELVILMKLNILEN